MKLGLKIARLGGLVAVFGLAVFVSTNSALAKERRVSFDCRDGLTKNVVLFPDEDSVEISLIGCKCGSAEEISALKEELKRRAAVMAAVPEGGQPAIFPAGGAPVYIYPIALGDKKDFTFYCYTPGQEIDYFMRAEEAAASD